MIIREGVETRKTDINTKMTFVPLRTEQSLMSLSTLAKRKGSRAKKKLYNLYLLQCRKCVDARYWMINTGDTCCRFLP